MANQLLGKSVLNASVSLFRSDLSDVIVGFQKTVSSEKACMVL